MKILYLTQGENIKGPFPKIDPLLIRGLQNLGAEVKKMRWGRHSDSETIVEKVFGRSVDLVKVWIAIRQYKPDLIYEATTLDEYALARDLPLVWSTQFGKAKRFLMMHGSKTEDLFAPKRKWYQRFARWLIRHVDAIGLLSHDEVADWKRFEPDGVYCKLNNPFLPDERAKGFERKFETGEPLRLLFIGRLIPSKGVMDLIDALPLILERVDCKLTIAGFGPLQGEIELRRQEPSLKGRIEFAGYLTGEALSSLYLQADIFVLPTYFGEGFPTVVTEALSFGLPVVTTQIRGCKDHLTDHKDVLFVKPLDPAEIAGKVIQLAEDPDLRQQLSLNGLVTIKEFEPDRVSKQYYECFERVQHG